MEMLAFFFDFKDLTAAIGATVGANLMWWNLSLARGAGHEMWPAQGIVCASSVSAPF